MYNIYTGRTSVAVQGAKDLASFVMATAGIKYISYFLNPKPKIHFLNPKPSTLDPNP